MTLSQIQVPAGRAIREAEAFLGRKHNELNAFDTLEHLVVAAAWPVLSPPLTLALLEIAQIEGRHHDALAHVERLMDLDPTDPLVLLSFAELALGTPDDWSLMDRVVRATVHVENKTPVDTAILLYRGRALSALGLPDAAIDVFTLANRRRKDRPDGLLHQIRYDRAVLYHETGQRARACRQFERVYAANPGFEGVAERLGVGEDDLWA